MALEEYRRKRRFGRTGEPVGADEEAGRHRYVVHKHAARRLHYDLRLEHEGVLKSWAVPKGPSLDPGQKRLAVQVEDHPVEYGDYEGLIPEGEYGAGPSALWDRGWWQALDDVDDGLARGRLRFRLQGEKLAGDWYLVRAGGRRGDGRQWLLIKAEDDYADPGRDVAGQGPDSVLTGRSLAEIADEEADAQPPGAAPPPGVPNPAALPGARQAALPTAPAPQLATLLSRVPSGDGWLHEIKYDGYRMLARLENGAVSLISRNGRDWSERLPAVAAAVARLPVAAALLDGEVVALRPDGRTDFQALQNLLAGEGEAVLAYYLFDLPHLNGQDLGRVPLAERKAALRGLLEAAGPTGTLRYSDHVRGQGEAIYREACQRGLEGIISKRAEAGYSSRRSRDWGKVKCIRRAEFVIGGFTEPQGSRTAFGALLLGYYDDDGRLHYAGKVGTGFDEPALRTLGDRLSRLERMTPPFVESPGAADIRSAHWVRPELVAEVKFSEWTGEGRLRHPAFVALREDKPAAEVRRDDPAQPGQLPAPAVALSHPERLFWPEAGISKAALADFYRDIADWALPHLTDRPLSLVRCPEGHGQQCFYQRHLGEGSPAAVAAGRDAAGEEFILIRDLDGLIGLVQMGALELHPWGARVEHLELPDRLTLDLDPGPGVDWRGVCDAAVEVREALAELGLESFVKTTGGKGLHVVVPLQPKLDWDAHKAFSRWIAEGLERRAPTRYTANMSKARRPGRIFVDYLRNGRGATAVAAYSTRARPGAPVAVPLRWEELDGLAGADLYTVDNLRRRLGALRGDPWPGFLESRQSISAGMRRAAEKAARPAPRRRRGAG